MTRKPWYVNMLARIEQKARCECSTQILIELGDDLKRSEMTEAERGAIVAELDRIISELRHVDEQVAKRYLEMIRQEIAIEV